MAADNIVLTGRELAWLKRLIASGKEHYFYVWSKWLRVRDEVFKLDKHECQMCKATGRYSKAALVHHVKHLKVRPDLALTITDEDGRRQLISLCKKCHELCHPERMRKQKSVRQGFLNQERWD